MYAQKVYQALGNTFQARLNCAKSNNSEWFEKHTEVIKNIVDSYLPHGSGFDTGCSFDYESSSGNKLVINTSYHHMDQYGGYHHWEDYKVIIRPSFMGFELRIMGRDWNGFKDYAYQIFDECLHEVVTA